MIRVLGLIFQVFSGMDQLYTRKTQEYIGFKQGTYTPFTVDMGDEDCYVFEHYKGC